MPAPATAPRGRACVGDLGPFRGTCATGSYSPSLPTGVGGSAPGTACWLSRAVPGRRPPNLACWLFGRWSWSSLSGGGGGASEFPKAPATGGRCVRGLPLDLPLAPLRSPSSPGCPLRRCSISRMRASRASSSVVWLLSCCFLRRPKKGASATMAGSGKTALCRAMGRLTACRPVRRGLRRCFRCGRCPSAPPRKNGQWFCHGGDCVSCCLIVHSRWCSARRCSLSEKGGWETHDCGRRPFGFQSRSSSSSVMVNAGGLTAGSWQ